jgi:hypothetical protein
MLGGRQPARAPCCANPSPKAAGREGGDQVNETVVARPQADLGYLAEQINREYRLCRAAFQNGLQHAYNAGILLLQAKEQCGHGEWSAWLDTNFEGSARTAQAYMQVARSWPMLTAPNAQHVAGLGLGDALKLLAAPREKPDDPALTTIQDHIALVERSRPVCLRLRAVLNGLAAAPETEGTLLAYHEVGKEAAEWVNELAESRLRCERQVGETATWLAETWSITPQEIGNHIDEIIELTDEFLAQPREQEARLKFERTARKAALVVNA